MVCHRFARNTNWFEYSNGLKWSNESPRNEPSEMLWMRLLTVSSSSCCCCCSMVLLEETLISCCSNLPMMAVCRSIRVWSCSFSSWNIFSSTCLCSSMSFTLFSRTLRRWRRKQVQHRGSFWRWTVAVNAWGTYTFLSFSLLISLVWTISCFSNLLVDREFSSSRRSSRVVWWIT